MPPPLMPGSAHHTLSVHSPGLQGPPTLWKTRPFARWSPLPPLPLLLLHPGRCWMPAASAASAKAMPCRSSSSTLPRCQGVCTAYAPYIPASARSRLARSSKSPWMTATPVAARVRAAGERASRVNARTMNPRERRWRRTAPPCWPVAPVTRMARPASCPSCGLPALLLSCHQPSPIILVRHPSLRP